MKQLSARFIGSLCVAAGSLVAALPVQAIVTIGIACRDTTPKTSTPNLTISNPGYLGCRGPTENPGPVFDGEPDGDPTTETRDPGLLNFYFGKKELRGIYSGTFDFKGYSEDPVTGGVVSNSPFRNDPHGPTGTLFFRDTLIGLFVLALEGERFPSTGPVDKPVLGSGSNFSFYLFDAAQSTVNTTGLVYDTQGLSKADGSGRSTSLAFAGLYVQPGGSVERVGAIPEPAGLALLATAFGALALTARRHGG